MALTDASANVVNKYAYTPFGKIVGQQETVSQPFKYVGKYGVMTEPNGLYYMKARYYDSSIGRFISEDPKGFDGGDVNLMAYVENNPVNFTDPTGLFKFTVLGQTVDIKLGGTLLGFNGQYDFGGFSSSNFSNSAVLPPLQAGISVDISVNPPSSNNYVSPFLGYKNLGVGTNIVYNPNTLEPSGLQGLNVSIGIPLPSGVPVGVSVPDAFSRGNSCNK